MAISHDVFFKVSILQYYYIVWKYNTTYALYMANIARKYNIMYVLYMAINDDIFSKVSILQYYYITILCGSTI